MQLPAVSTIEISEYKVAFVLVRQNGRMNDDFFMSIRGLAYRTQIWLDTNVLVKLLSIRVHTLCSRATAFSVFFGTYHTVAGFGSY